MEGACQLWFGHSVSSSGEVIEEVYAPSPPKVVVKDVVEIFVHELLKKRRRYAEQVTNAPTPEVQPYRAARKFNIIPLEKMAAGWEHVQCVETGDVKMFCQRHTFLQHCRVPAVLSANDLRRDKRQDLHTIPFLDQVPKKTLCAKFSPQISRRISTTLPGQSQPWRH